MRVGQSPAVCSTQDQSSRPAGLKPGTYTGLQSIQFASGIFRSLLQPRFQQRHVLFFQVHEHNPRAHIGL